MCDFRRLLFYSNKNIASLVIESLVAAVITDLFYCLTYDFLVVESRFRRDFAKDHDHACLCCRFTGYFRERIFGKACIELNPKSVYLLFKRWIPYNRIRNLVTDFIGMSLSDGL